MNKLFLVLALSLIALTVFSAEWVPAGSQTPGKPVVEVVSSNIEETVVSVTIPGYYRDTKDIGGVSYAYFTVPGCANMMEKGSPSLPFLAFDVAVNPAGEVSATCDIKASATTREDKYFPSKGHFTRDIDPSSVLHVFSEAYTTDEFYPKNTVAAGEPFIMRSVRGVNISVRPFRYNPVTGEVSVATHMLIKIRTQGSGGSNILGRAPAAVPKDFTSLYGKRFINYAAYSARYTPVSEQGKMLIITNDTFYDAMLPLYYWKLQKGISTKIVKLSTIGTTADQVKSYIQNEYDTNGVTFILLVGDANEMPYLTGTSGNVVGEASDPRYALLAGSDQYPDAFVSRFPCQTVSEASTMVNRVINYEETPSTSGEWYHRAFGIAGDDDGGTGLTDWQRVNLLRDKLKTPAYNYTVFDEIYHASATPSDVATAVNGGRGLGLYIGHGGETFWVTSGFSVTDVYNLTNSGTVPLILDVACVNGKFNYGGDCFAEAWLKAGTPAAPKGALAMYASSTNQSWVPPADGQTESVDLMVAEEFHSVGAICVNGCMGGMDLWPGAEAEQLYQQWHIFGDASAMIFTDTPASMTVTHNAILPVGQASYSVTVQGIEGALCALYDPASHTLHGSAFTGADGTAEIMLDPVPAAPATMTLTVTAFNRVPDISQVDVIVPEGPWFVHESHLINDPLGNNDHTLNPGESVVMPVSLRNIGVEQGTEVTAILSSSSPYVTITDNSASFPDANVNSVVQSLADHFSFSVSASAPNGALLPFSISWSAAGGYSGSASFTVAVCSVLTISNVQVASVADDSAVITWTTNYPSTSEVIFGTATPPSTSASDTALVTSHSVLLTGLAGCTDYYFSVISTSPFCYTAVDTNSGAYYRFKSFKRDYLYGPDTVESGTGIWTASNGGTSIWHRDSCKASSGSWSWKAGLSDSPTCTGNYGSSVTTYLTSSGINLGAAGHGYHLRFREWYLTENGYDLCTVQISTNGTTYTDFSPQRSGASGGWISRDYDLAAYSGTVYIRFRFTSNSNTGSLGWFVDDIDVSFNTSCAPVMAVNSVSFADDCLGTGSGDGDGYLDPGEEAVVTVTLNNTGYLAATGVWAELDTTAEGVTVLDDTASFPGIPVGGSGTSVSPHFRIRLSETIACGTVIPFTVSAHSNEGDSDGSFELEVGHWVNPVTNLISESFDGTTFPPSGWAKADVTGTSGDWLRSTGTVLPTGGGTHSGAGLGYFKASTSGNTTRLYRSSGSAIPSGSVSAQVTFWMYHDTGNPTKTDKIQVQVSTDGTTWVIPGSNQFLRCNGSTGWQQHTVDLSGYIGQSIRLGFLGTWMGGNYCHIDDVVLSYNGADYCVSNACTPSLPAPPEIAVGMSESDSQIWSEDKVTQSWPSAAGATGYRLYRGTLADLPNLTGAGTDSCTKYDGTGTSVNLSGDDPSGVAGGLYWYLVTAYNGAGEGSAGTGRTVNSSGACAP